MPSPPSPRRLPRPEIRYRGRRTFAAPILAVLLAAGAACTSAPPPSPVRPPVARPQPLALEAEDRPYLIDPLEGYPRAVDPDVRDRLLDVWRDLLEVGDTAGATRT